MKNEGKSSIFLPPFFYIYSFVRIWERMWKMYFASWIHIPKYEEMFNIFTVITEHFDLMLSSFSSLCNAHNPHFTPFGISLLFIVSMSMPEMRWYSYNVSIFLLLPSFKRSHFLSFILFYACFMQKNEKFFLFSLEVLSSWQ
jgi:hypothetical protein